MEQAQYTVNEKTTKWKAFLAENKIECFSVEEKQDENETAIFRSQIQIKGQVLPMAILLDKSVYALLQVQLATGVVTDKVFTKIAPYLNELNNKYRISKFLTSPNGDLLLNVCMTFETGTFNPALLNAVTMETAKFLETEYAPIMARVWKSIK